MMDSPRHFGMDRSEHLVDTGNCEHCPYIKSSLLFITLQQDRFRKQLERTMEDAEEIEQQKDLLPQEERPTLGVGRVVEILARNHDAAISGDMRYIRNRVKNCTGPKCEIIRRGKLGKRIMWHCISPQSLQPPEQSA